MNPMADCKKFTEKPNDGDESHGWQWETYQTTQWWWCIPRLTVRNLLKTPMMAMNPTADSEKLTKQPNDGDQSHGWQ